MTKMNNSTSCEHHNFQADVGVARIEDKKRFMAEIRVRCADCGTPFQFMGLPPGLNYDGATVSLDGLEANIGIRPQGQRPSPLDHLMGYTVTALPINDGSKEQDGASVVINGIEVPAPETRPLAPDQTYYTPYLCVEECVAPCFWSNAEVSGEPKRSVGESA